MIGWRWPRISGKRIRSTPSPGLKLLSSPSRQPRTSVSCCRCSWAEDLAVSIGWVMFMPSPLAPSTIVLPSRVLGPGRARGRRGRLNPAGGGPHWLSLRLCECPRGCRPSPHDLLPPAPAFAGHEFGRDLGRLRPPSPPKTSRACSLGIISRSRIGSRRPAKTRSRPRSFTSARTACVGGLRQNEGRTCGLGLYLSVEVISQWVT